MKSPWKFLAQLTSRRRTAEAHGSSIVHDSHADASESDTQQPPQLSSSSAEVSSPSGSEEEPTVDHAGPHESRIDLDFAKTVSAPVDGNEIQRPDHQGVPSVANGPGSESRTGKKSSRRKQRGRGKAKRAFVVSESAVGKNEDQNAQTLPSGDPFFHEVEALDEEIKKLKSQMAQKLYLQNSQLKTMLKRFDVS